MSNIDYQAIIAVAGIALVGKIIWDWLSKKNSVGLGTHHSQILERLDKWHYGARAQNGTLRPEEVRTAVLKELGSLLIAINKLIKHLEERPCIMEKD